MKKNRGFSLIEVLVTLVLTSIGILGMVALQGQAISHTQEAVQRNHAISLAEEMVEILRTYRDEVYVNTPPKSVGYSELKSSTEFYTSSGALSFSASDCASPAQTAKQAAGCWLKKVNARLPGSEEAGVVAKFRLCPSFKLATSGEAECDASYKGSSLAIQVAWKNRESVCGPQSNSDICVYVMRVEI